MRQLGRFRFQEFLSRWRIKEEIANRDRGSRRQAGFLHAEDLATCNLDDGP